MSAATVAHRPQAGSLAEVLDLILDKGLVIDAFVRVSLVGIELLTVDARVVVAGVDTYLHFAEATNRLDIRGRAEDYDADLKDLVSGTSQSVAEGKTRGVLEGGRDMIMSALGREEEESKGNNRSKKES